MQKRPAISILFLIVFTATLSATYAVCSPPASGDWIVSGTEQCDGQSVIINGNVLIGSADRLTINTSTFTLNTTSDREFSVYVFSNGYFASINSNFYRLNETWDIIANETSTVNLTFTNITNGTTLRFTDTAESILETVNFNDDINTNDQTTHTWTSLHVGPVEETTTQTVVFIDDNSTVTCNDCTFEGLTKFGQSVGAAPQITMTNSNLSGEVQLQRAANVSFIGTNYWNSTTNIAHTPQLRGNLTFLSAAPTSIFLATQYTRYYPVYITNQYLLPESGRTVNITNSSGALFFSGVTDGNGYVLAAMTYNSTYCGTNALNCDNDFNITVGNSSALLGLQTNTPIELVYLTLDYVPEFGEWVMIIMVGGLLGCMAIYRRRNL